jgi:gamma-glutamylcyclotransferase (GGCT)/AIG2-like uncharacterized protein YtfP
MTAKKQSTRGTSGSRFLFSYGTLQPRHAPAEIAATVRRLRRVGKGSVRGRLYDLGEYPGAVLSRNGPLVVGQVFELPDDPEILSRLDEYEGFDPARPKGSLFLRKRCLVKLQNGKKLLCWMYTYNRAPGAAPAVGNGDYSKHRHSTDHS